MIGGVVLAAGEGRRFGGPKQLAELGGRPLVEHALAAMFAVPAIERIVVVLGAQAGRIRDHADLGGVEVVVAGDWSEGISASLRAGVAVLAEAEAVVVLLADQPLITPQVIAAVLDRGDSRAPAARATFGGAPGHPVVIKRELFGDVARLEGDAGARDLLELAGVATVECGHLASAHDVDTREDLQAIGGEVGSRR
ncbi:MAG: nucleotidyltransferase family protein [Solirubrobacterales bacterium]